MYIEQTHWKQKFTIGCTLHTWVQKCVSICQIKWIISYTADTNLRTIYPRSHIWLESKILPCRSTALGPLRKTTIDDTALSIDTQKEKENGVETHRYHLWIHSFKELRNLSQAVSTIWISNQAVVSLVLYLGNKSDMKHITDCRNGWSA